MSKDVNGNISIGDIDFAFFKTFPYPSILIRNISVADSGFKNHHRPFFSADKLYAELNLFALMRKEFVVRGIRVEKGSMYLYTDASGYTNLYLMRKKANSSGNFGNAGNSNSMLRKIDLIDFTITFDNEKDKKLFDGTVHHLQLKISNDDTAIYFKAVADILVKHLAFNTQKGSFLTGKNFEGNFNFSFSKNVNRLHFDSIDFRINNYPFNMSGDFGLGNAGNHFNIRLHTHRLPYAEGKSLLASKIDSSISVVNVDKPLDADAWLNGFLNGGDPSIIVKWKVADAHLNTPILNFDHASFSGYYNDEVVKGKPPADSNSEVHIDDFSAQWRHFPVMSKNIEIMDLSTPHLTCDLKSDFPVTKFNDFFQNNTILFRSGSASVNVTYSGPLEKNKSTNSIVNGSIVFENGDIVYLPRNAEMKNVNGNVSIKNSDVHIDSLQFHILGNTVTMSAVAKNLITFLTSEPDKAVIDCDIYSPQLNLAPFVFLLRPRRESNNSAGALHTISSEIDNVLINGRIRVSLKTPHLMYKKFEASDVHANITLLPDRYDIRNVTMNSAGGHLGLSGGLTTKDNQHETNIDATLSNIDISKIFFVFNNFGQNTLTSKNIAGSLDARIKAQLILDNAGNPDPESIQSTVDFSLDHGALYNFGPVQKIQSFIFRHRKLDSIKFAELKDRFLIADRKIRINRMEIESTAFSMYVEGIYGLSGSTDMTIQLPLRNLKKHDKDFKPKNRGVSNSAGLSFYIHAISDSDGKVQFKPEVLHFLKGGK